MKKFIRLHKKFLSFLFVFVIIIASLAIIFNSPKGNFGGDGPTNPVDPEQTASNKDFENVFFGRKPVFDNVTSLILAEDRPAQQNQPKESAQPIAWQNTKYSSEKIVNNQIVDENGVSYPIHEYTPLLIPNDPLSGGWWQTTSNITGAWDRTFSLKQTTLAIIDTGFALNHEEFQDRWHTNSGESGLTSSEAPSKLNCTDRSLALNRNCNNIDDDFDGILDNESGATGEQNPSLLNCTDSSKILDKSCNLIDDDSNGLIDDANGWDFTSFYPSVQAGKLNPTGNSTTHGTNVAGFAAASGNNSKGVAGVDWQTKILPIQAIDDDGYGDTLSVSRAIRYAADQGADVINLSLGTPYPDTYLRQAVAYAISKGAIVVAAAGNDGCNCMVYPANYDEVVAVGAVNSLNQRASFSSYGSNLDIVAPGSNMISPTYSSSGSSNSYQTGLSGTSFSSPLVAGALSLLKSYQPNASIQQLLAIIAENTNRTNIASSEIKSTTSGYGILDVSLASQRATSTYTPAVQYSFSPVSGGRTLGLYEPTSNFYIYQCENGKKGSTTLYRLSASGSTIYSISAVEAYRAVALGYGLQTSYGYCISLPTDTPQLLRTLSIPREFENNFSK